MHFTGNAGVVMAGSDDETDFHSQLEYQYRNLYARFNSVVSRQDVANQLPISVSSCNISGNVITSSCSLRDTQN